MFRSRRVNSKISNLHKRSLCIGHKNNYSSYGDLLAKDKSVTIYQKNIQSLAIELFRVTRNLSNVIMCNILKSKNIDLQFAVTNRIREKLR